MHTIPGTGCATVSDDLLATPNARPCNRWCMDHSALDLEWMCNTGENRYNKRRSRRAGFITREHWLKYFNLLMPRQQILPGMGSPLAKRRRNKLSSDDWLRSCGGVSFQVEEPLSVLPTRLGSDEFTHQNLLFLEDKPWR